MILLDTNVISELMRKPHERDASVAVFLSGCSLEDLYIPAIAAAEIRYGIERLPSGKRRSEIAQNFETLLASGFASRVPAFDAACAKAYAIARTLRQRAGRPIELQDGLIAGMALAYGATLATRNVADFDGYGLSLINPWEAEV